MAELSNMMAAPTRSDSAVALDMKTNGVYPGGDVLQTVQSYAKSVPTADAAGYRIPETPLGIRRPVRVLIIGFGAAAINLVHILHNDKRSIQVQCYEKNPEVAGTWFENKYPGCTCDVPAANYQFSWHPKPDWTSYYATSQEILGYFKDIVRHHGFSSNVELNHTVVGAWWNEELGKWRIKIQPAEGEAFFDEGEILINATGVLNNWKWPLIPGVEKFKNRTHSAAWDESLSLDNKVVGVIGNGSSAVQIIPAIFDKIDQLKVFMRSTTWITTGFVQKYAGENGANFEYSEEQKRRFSEHPDEHLEYRKLIEAEINQRFKFIINGSAEQRESLEFSTKDMAKKLGGQEDLIKRLVPTNYGIGCRRPTPGNGFLECLADREKSEVVFGEIREITEEGIITEDGKLHKLDVLICATGFDVSFIPKFPIIGLDNRDLRKEWAGHPATYLSATVPHFPNYFMINGPFGPYAHGSILPVIEIISRYVEKFIAKYQTQNIKSFHPKQEAVDDFKQHRELFLLRTAWSSPCRSWFKGGKADGPIMMWPGSRLHFFGAMEDPRWEDYNWTYENGNRFSYFGSGFSARELDGSDTTWYIEKV